MVMHLSGSTEILIFNSLPDRPPATEFGKGFAKIIGNNYFIFCVSNATEWHSKGYSALLADRPAASDLGPGEWIAEGVRYLSNGEIYTPEFTSNFPVDLANSSDPDKGAAMVGFLQSGVNATGRTIQEKLRDFISVKDFGAIGDGVADDSAAIQAAEDAGVLIGDALGGRYPKIHFPNGTYKCNHLTWKRVCSWVGEEVGNTRLVYNGPDNTAGSYIVGLAVSSGAVPYSGFYNMTFVGFDSGDTSNPSAAHAILNLGTQLDWGFKLENLHFSSFFDDALQLRGTNSVFVNLFINRVRFDGCGGFGIFIGSNNSNSGSPMVLDQFTLDNNIIGNYATKMTGQGRYDGSRWGKGLLRLDDGQSVSCHIANARIELNKKLVAHNNAFSLIYANNTIGGSRSFINVSNIQGTGRNDQPIIFCKDVTGRVTLRHSDIGMSAYAKLYEGTSLERDLYKNQVQIGFSGSNTQMPTGLQLYGHQLEWRGNPPEQLPSHGGYYKYGDMVFNSAPGIGRAAMWQCRWPTIGAAVANSGNITTAAVATSDSNVVSVPASTLSNFGVGINITLVGAGAAGADLDTRVTAVDEQDNKITLNDAASTSVEPCTIKFKSAQFSPVLYVPGVSADKGNAGFTLTLGTSEPTAYVNTPLTANRTITLSTNTSNLGTVAQANGGKFRVVRTANSTGAFTLDIPHNGGTKSLSTGQWADFEFTGSVWILTASGSL
jgi:hypothetical protein